MKNNYTIWDINDCTCLYLGKEVRGNRTRVVSIMIQPRNCPPIRYLMAGLSEIYLLIIFYLKSSTNILPTNYSLDINNEFQRENGR